jgi:GT2 family glycosyltransferase/SAM-dependent methyltransferase
MWRRVHARWQGRPDRPPSPAERHYRLWLAHDRTSLARRISLWREARALPYRPLVSLLMPVYDIGERWLRAAVDSVRAQAYPHWELCAVDDASPAAHVRPFLQELAHRDRRVRLQLLDRNEGIGGALRHALGLARGELVGLIDHDDVLHREALLEVVRRFGEERTLDVVYTDHDCRDAGGRRHSPFFKPDWSPDLLLSMNYITHFVVARRERVLEAGGYRPGYDGAEDHDLLLRLSERTSRIGHVARPLYSWGQSPASTSSQPAAKPHAHEAGRRAVQDALTRRGIAGEVLDGRGPYRYRVRRRIEGRPLVSIVVAPEAGGASLDRCLASLLASTAYAPHEVVVTDPVGPDATRARRWIEGAQSARGAHVVLVRDNCEAVDAAWIEALLEHSQRPEVGAAGARRVTPDGRIKHAGLVLGMQGLAGNIFAGLPDEHPSYWGLAHVIRDVAAVDGFCLMTRRELLLGPGGLDPMLPAFEDVDYCLRRRQQGLSIVYTPYAVLREHAPAASALADADRDAAAARLRGRWGDVLARDPLYSPHLALDRADCSLRIRRPLPDGGLRRTRWRFRGRFHGEGIEIGALHDPMPVDARRARVRHVDRLTPAEQAEHYPELADRTLVTPDIVAPAHGLATIGAGQLDFVIASQLLPQLEDPIAALVEWHRVLKPDGLLFLAVSDHRRTEDRARAAVTIEHLVQDHQDGGAASRAGHYDEYVRASRPIAGDRDPRDLMARGYAATFHPFTPDGVRELLRYMDEAMGCEWLVVDGSEPARGGDELLLLLRARH